MKRIFAILALFCVMAIPAVAQDDVFDDEISVADLQGNWQYDEPVVQMTGSNIISKLGKPIAAHKVKGELKKEYKKLGLKSKNFSIVFGAGGTYALQIGSINLLSGNYAYDRQQQVIVFKWHGFALSGDVKKNGNRIEFAMPTDQFLRLVKFIGSFIHTSSIDGLTTLAENYTNVKIGLAIKKQ